MATQPAPGQQHARHGRQRAVHRQAQQLRLQGIQPRDRRGRLGGHPARFPEVQQPRRHEAHHRDRREETIGRLRLRFLGLQAGLQALVEFLDQGSRRVVHRPDQRLLQRLGPLVGVQHPLQGLDPLGRGRLPEPDGPAIDRLVRARGTAGTSRRPDPYRAATDQESRPPRLAAVAASEVEVHPSRRPHAGDVLEDQAESLAARRFEDHAVLIDPDQETMAACGALARILIDVRLAIRDADPACARAGGRRPDPPARFQPAVRLPIPSGPRPRDHLLGRRHRPRGADQIRLVDQARDHHRRPTAARVGPGREGGADGQDRLEEESLPPLLRAPDRARAGHRPLAVGGGRDRRVLDEQVPSGLAQLLLDRATMAVLDRVGSDFASVEEVVGGVDVVLAGEQLGDGRPGPFGEGSGVGHETTPAGAMPEPDPWELRGGPGIRRRLMDRSPSQHDWLHPRCRSRGAAAHATKFSGMTNAERGNALSDAPRRSRRPRGDAERPGRHSHADNKLHGAG